MKTRHEKVQYLDKFTARKVQDDQIQLLANLPDSLDAWTTQYLHLAVIVPGQSTWPQNRPLDVNLALLVSRNTPFIH
jgi:hypothetical protein